jgi:hypothetical protein
MIAALASVASLALAALSPCPATASSLPVVGDWDGDNTTTIGVARPDTETGNWRWLLRDSNSGGSPDADFLFGNKYTDLPVAGDWDGDNTTTVGVVRPDAESANWIWLLRDSNSGGSPDLEFSFGNKYEDVPVVGDWDGDNTTTIGVARPDAETGNWRWLLRDSNSGGSPDADFLFGDAGD